MIETVLKVPMGKRFASIGRGLRSASAAICVIQHENESLMHGVGILYPDIEHLYFAEDKTNDPAKLWRGMYAATKISCLSDEMLGIAVAISDESIPLDDIRFAKAEKCLMYGYNVEKLRAEVFAQEPHPDDIQKIVLGFKFLRAPIYDPFAQVPEKEGGTSWDIFPKILTGMASLSTAI